MDASPVVTIEFVYDDAFIFAAVQRYNATCLSWWRKHLFKMLGVTLALFSAALMLVKGREGIIVLATGCFFWFIKVNPPALFVARLRKLPTFGQTFAGEISAEGFSCRGEFESVWEHWRCIRRAFEFPDGFMLERYEGGGRWIPDDCIVSGDHAALADLIHQHLGRLVPARIGLFSTIRRRSQRPLA